jgi:phytoene dehydrogenase-like protein
MLGWEMSPDQLGTHRADVVGPIKNLYFVGHWVQPGGGITPVIMSAMKVAKMITNGTVNGSLAAKGLETPEPALSCCPP